MDCWINGAVPFPTVLDLQWSQWTNTCWLYVQAVLKTSRNRLAVVLTSRNRLATVLTSRNRLATVLTSRNRLAAVLKSGCKKESLLLGSFFY